MHEHPRRVEDPPQRRQPGALDLLQHGVDERACVTTGLDLGTRVLERGPGGRNRKRARLGRDSLVAQQLVDRRQVAKGTGPVHARQV